MTELCRFVMIRPPQKKDAPKFVVQLNLDPSPLASTLIAAKSEPEPRAAMTRVAQAFAGSSEFVSAPATLPIAESFAMLERAVTSAEQATVTDLEQHVVEAFGGSASEIRDSAEFSRTRAAIADSILALSVAPNDDPILLDELGRVLRLMDLVGRIADQDTLLEEPGAPSALLSEVLIAPSSVFPLPPDPSDDSPDDEEPDGRGTAAEVENLRARASALSDLRNHLLDMNPEDYRDAAPLTTQSSQGDEDGVSAPTASAATSATATTTTTTLPTPGSESSDGQNGLLLGLLLSHDAIDRLESTHQQILGDLRVDLTRTPVTSVVERLDTERSRVRRRLAQLVPADATQRVRIGRTSIAAGSFTAPAAGTKAAPSSKKKMSKVRPVGVGTLLRIKEHIKRYEPGEVAHIENVLNGESKERGTRRLRRTEETLTSLLETSSEEERDLQTTSRFELQQEASKTMQEEKAFEVGASVSAAYGSWFKVDANTGYSSKTAKSDAEKRAVSLAKEVTERTVAKLSERIREERIVKVIEEFEETNKHAVKNDDGAGHVIGVYQWVDKVYEAQLYDYGQRTFFDFMVPEPGAFVLEALRQPHGEVLEEPVPFTKRPEDIDEDNYQDLALPYRATGLPVPPPEVKEIAVNFDKQAQAFAEAQTHSTTIEIPEGYYAWKAIWQIQYRAFMKDDEGQEVDPDYKYWYLHIGTHTWGGHGRHADGSKALSNRVDGIPILVVGTYAIYLSGNITVLCKAQQRKKEEWKAKVHELITQAYLKARADYEEKLANAAAQVGVQIQGRNPLENRLIERAELKKQCIALLRGENISQSQIDAILDKDDFRGIDFAQVYREGAYIRFLEQAFEWENMSYVFYPYYWGRKRLWFDRVLLQDVDPIHAEFLKAGAARVVVPVRLNFEESVLHFLESGHVWSGGRAPVIGDKTYVDIVQELKEQKQAPGQETPVGEPWELRIPTTLVRLSPDGKLPEWTKDDDGNWHGA